jgi:5-methylcytosine-specific restriction endonuclease McrA
MNALARVVKRNWYYKNKDYVRARWKIWYQKNIERRRTYLQIYSQERLKDPAKRAHRSKYMSMYMRNYWHQTPERVERYARICREYQQKHPELYRAIAAKYRAKKRNAAVGVVDYTLIIKRDRSRCGICNRHVKRCDRAFDHIIPLSRGGAHSMENIQVAHRHCNQRKGMKTLVLNLDRLRGAIA